MFALSVEVLKLNVMLCMMWLMANRLIIELFKLVRLVVMQSLKLKFKGGYPKKPCGACVGSFFRSQPNFYFFEL